MVNSLNGYIGSLSIGAITDYEKWVFLKATRKGNEDWVVRKFSSYSLPHSTLSSQIHFKIPALDKLCLLFLNEQEAQTTISQTTSQQQ